MAAITTKSVLVLAFVRCVVAFPVFGPSLGWSFGVNNFEIPGVTTSSIPSFGVGAVQLEGLLGTVAANVSETDRRPDADHPFIVPGPTDQRGACPALNAMANHGYLPRNGIATAAQAINASAHVFNAGVDVATYLATLQVAFTGNIETETFSIGGEDLRTYSPGDGAGSIQAGRQYGLDGHGRIEADASATRGDFRLTDGFSHIGVGERFRRFVAAAKANDGQFDLTAVKKLFEQNVKLSIANNPDFFLDGFVLGGNLGAYALLALNFANGTLGFGGTANYETASSILGFEVNARGDFCNVPERLPSNWFRSSKTFDFATGFLPTVPQIYNAKPFLKNDFGKILGDPARSIDLVCAQFDTLLSSVPSALAYYSAPQKVEAAIDYIFQKLVVGLGIESAFGCQVPRPQANQTDLYPLPPVNTQLQPSGAGGGQQYGVCS